MSNQSQQKIASQNNDVNKLQLKYQSICQTDLYFQEKQNKKKFFNYSQQEVKFFCYQKSATFTQDTQYRNLQHIFFLIYQNKKIIDNLNRKFAGIEEIISQIQKEKIIPNDQKNGLSPKIPNKFFKNQLKNRQINIHQRLFSNLFVNRSKNPQYQLMLINQLESKFYKQRNFQIKIKICLRDEQKTRIRNSNILNLCIGLLNDEGKWITQNKYGESLLKGRTQVQLINGEAIFKKIYFRQISKNFNGSGFTIVVYAIKSAIQYQHKCINSQFLEQDNIYPLFIRNIKVFSRKYK